MTANACFGAATRYETLHPVPGFESTDYAYRDGRIVWAGPQGAQHNPAAQHPRHAYEPWQPRRIAVDPRRLNSGAQLALAALERLGGLDGLDGLDGLEQRDSGYTQGLLPWLAGRAMPFPLTLAQCRFDAIRQALGASELATFESAALLVLGVGQGLTPSGDDFVGGIFFALAHAPREAWALELPNTKARIRAAAQSATNVISAALLGDLMDGASFAALHELLAALQSCDVIKIEAACAALVGIGASSGADMLAGVLLAIATAPLPLLPSLRALAPTSLGRQPGT